MRQVLERMSRSARWLLAIGVLLSSAPAAAQSDPDIRGLVPFMMLVVDTSGSMERLPACGCVTPGCEECLPQCSLPNVAGVPPKDAQGHELKKNRWGVVLEALTGSFKDFQCEELARTIDNGMDYDVGYHLPYFQPWDCNSQTAGTPCAYNSANSTLDQSTNGIIDAYSNRMRFGLMTFDGFDTYVGAPPLVPALQFQQTLSDSVQGLWSYGGPHSFHYPHCTEDYMIDTGARSAVADQGTLVSLNSCLGGGAPGASPECPSWCTNCAGDQITIGSDIKKSLLKTRPYGGTPIAASLDDLYEHLKNDLTDQFGSCRHRFAMLVTDGYPDDDYRNFGCDCANESPVDCGGDPDTARMHCPYPKAEDAARYLLHGRPNTTDQPLIEQLFVVGLSIDDSAVFAKLNDIAVAGCGAAGGCADADGNTALFADDLSKLVQNLDAVMTKAAGDPISRSVPAFASGTQPSTTRTQYQLNTGFLVGTGPADPWSGIIERRVFSCGSNGALNEQDITADADNNFHDVLNGPLGDNRNLLTTFPQTGNSPDGYMFSGSTSDPCGLGCSMQLFDTAATPARLAVADTTARDAVVAWVRGTSGPRRTKRLGDIYHSSPVVVGPPQFDTSDDAFNLFRQRPEIAQRPLTLFVGSNDGILHAFSVEEYPGDVALNLHAAKAGEEMWGFVPPLLLNDLKDYKDSHHYSMDGTPVVKNVYFSRIKGDDATGQEYHTVLITGMREGGNAYIALDVTNPTEPKFLWQFTDIDTSVTPAHPVMGKTFGQAAVAQATFLDPSGTVKNGAVAILPGGVGLLGESGLAGDCTNQVTNPQVRDGTGTSAPTFKTLAPQLSGADGIISTRSDVRCWQDIGRALYFVDVETGKLIKKIHKDSTGKPYFPSPIVGTPAIFGSDIGSRASRAFVTDADGVIWRIDLRADDQDNTIVYANDKSAAPDVGWTVRPFHDMFWGTAPDAGELSYEAPLLSVDNEGNVVVIAGSGDNNNFVKPAIRNRVVSLTEKMFPGGGTNPPVYKASLNWEKRVKNATDTTGLVPSELVTGTMGLFNGQLFFGTFIAVTGADACDLGKGRIHAVDYLLRDKNDANGTSPETYGPLQFPSSELAADSTGTSVINVAPADALDNFMIMGLGVTQRQTCSVVDETNFDVYSDTLPGVSSIQQPAIYLVAQASGGKGYGSAIQTRAGSVLGSVEVQLKKTSTTSQVTSWATSVE